MEEFLIEVKQAFARDVRYMAYADDLVFIVEHRSLKRLI